MDGRSRIYPYSPQRKVRRHQLIFRINLPTDTQEPQFRNQTKKAEKSNTPLSRSTALSAFFDESDLYGVVFTVEHSSLARSYELPQQPGSVGD